MLAGAKLPKEECGKDVICLGDNHRSFEPILESKIEACKTKYNVVEGFDHLSIPEPLYRIEVGETLIGLGKELELEIRFGVDGEEDLIVTPNQLKQRLVRQALSSHLLPLHVRLRDFITPYMELLCHTARHSSTFVKKLRFSKGSSKQSED